MTTSRSILAAFAAVSLLTVASYARQGTRTNGNQGRNQDGNCVNEVADYDGARPQGFGRGQGRGRGYGRGGQGAGRQGRQGRQSQQILDIGPISEAETDYVLKMRQEEKLARDVYLTLGKRWSANVFKNISGSEQRHMDAIGRIVAAKALDDPAADDKVGVYADSAFGKLYVKLTGQGQASYTAALQVGAYIEELDILDLQVALDEVENEFIATVFQNLMRGSHNHLRAFTRGLQTQGQTYVPQLMTQEDYDAIVNGPVKRGVGNGNCDNQRSNNNPVSQNNK